jgi:DNA-binding MarR family transcriptional regulator
MRFEEHLGKHKGDGISGKEIAERLGRSSPTATTAINALLERGAIRAQGARRIAA